MIPRIDWDAWQQCRESSKKNWFEFTFHEVFFSLFEFKFVNWNVHKNVREVLLLDGANWNELNWLATWSERHATGFLLFFCRVVNSFWIDRKLVVLGRFKSWKEDFNKFKLMLELMNCWMGLRADGVSQIAKARISTSIFCARIGFHHCCATF